MTRTALPSSGSGQVGDPSQGRGGTGRCGGGAEARGAGRGPRPYAATDLLDPRPWASERPKGWRTSTCRNPQRGVDVSTRHWVGESLGNMALVEGPQLHPSFTGTLGPARRRRRTSSTRQDGRLKTGAKGDGPTGKTRLG